MAVADLEPGGLGGSFEPHSGTNYFNFMGKFKKNLVKCRKPFPVGGFESPVQKSWIRN